MFKKFVGFEKKLLPCKPISIRSLKSINQNIGHEVQIDNHLSFLLLFDVICPAHQRRKRKPTNA